MNSITFYLEDDNNKEVDFNQETLTLHYKWLKFKQISFLCYKWAFKNLKLIVVALVKNTILVQKTLLVK